MLQGISNKNKGLFLSLILFELVILVGFRADQLPGLLGLPLLYFLVKSVYDGSYTHLLLLLNKKIFLVLLVLQALGWFMLVFVDYFSISYNINDTGNFAHVIFNIASGYGFYNYILQIPAWVDHFTPNLSMFVPVFWIEPTFLWLPLARWMAYIICLPILWEISKFYLQDKRLRYLVLLLWLINYPYIKVLLNEFHPNTLSSPFLLLAFYLYLKRYYVLFTLDLFWICGFKEHMALAWLSVGAWLFFFERKKKVGSIIMGGGIIAGLTIVYILTPYLSGGIPTHQLGKFGPFNLLIWKALYIFLILLSVGFLPLLNPKTLIFILPAFGISLVSKSYHLANITSYSNDLPVTIVFIAVIIALSELEKRGSWFFHISQKRQKIAILVSLLGIIIFNTYSEIYPAREIRYHWPTNENFETISEIHHFQKEIEPQRVLWAVDSLGIYFINMPYLRLILNMNSSFQEKKPHYILLADHINHWPLDQKYEEFKQKIEEACQKDQYEKLSGFYRLQIYKSKN